MISLSNPTGRNTECRVLRTSHGAALFFSYETLIGVFDPSDGRYYRVANSWGPTTGRHFNECGLKEAQTVTEAALADLATDALAWHRDFKKRLILEDTKPTTMDRLEELEAVERDEADYENLFEGVGEDESMHQCPHCEGLFAHPADEDPTICPGCGADGPFAHITQ